MSNRRRVFALGLAMGAAVLTAGLSAAPAMAAPSSAVQATVTRMHVCAQDLYVRNAPAGQVIGTLYQGQTFDVERYSPSGQWAYGMAYGHVNQHGWVEAAYLC